MTTIPIAIWRMRRIWNQRKGRLLFEDTHLIPCVLSPTRIIVRSRTMTVAPTINFRTQSGTSRSPSPLDFSHTRLNSNKDRVLAYYEEEMKEGKVIKVQDVAFITYVDSCSMPDHRQSTSPVFKHSCSTCTPNISSSHPSDPNQTAELGPLKSSLLLRTVYLDLRLNPSTALPIRYLGLHIPRPFQLTTATQYDVPALKFIALEAIERGLGRCDAVRETFSRFAS